MTEYTIKLEGMFAVTKGPRDKSWIAKVECDLGALPEAILPDLIRHGLKQKVADSASGAQTEAEAAGPMQKALDAILDGDWSSRGEGNDGTRTLALVRLYKAAMPGDKAKLFAKFSASEQARRAMDNEAKFGADMIAAEITKIEKEREERAAANAERKAEMAKLAGTLDFDF